MAEALLNHLAGDRFRAQSAGLESGALHPLVVEVMGEIGLDISLNRCKDVFDFYRQGVLFKYVISVCDDTQAERCPVFPGHTQRVHCSFPDPAALTGSREERLAQCREIRNQIKAWLEKWIEQAE
jgi:arsenate reductase (thioredoxin)